MFVEIEREVYTGEDRIKYLNCKVVDLKEVEKYYEQYNEDGMNRWLLDLVSDKDYNQMIEEYRRTSLANYNNEKNIKKFIRSKNKK